VCISDDDCKISYEYLSSEEIDPYLVSGESPVKKSDIRAAKKWPDARSCLVRVERDAENPDIAKIDWKQMRRAEDIEVCLGLQQAFVQKPEFPTGLSCKT